MASTDLTAGSGQRHAPEKHRSDIIVRGTPQRARLFRRDSWPRVPYRLTLAHTGCRTSTTSAVVSATQCKGHCHTDTSFNLRRPGMVMRSMVAAAKAVKLSWFPDVYTTVLFKPVAIRHEYGRNVYTFLSRGLSSPSQHPCTPPRSRRGWRRCSPSLPCGHHKGRRHRWPSCRPMRSSGPSM